jgi:multisubunit Na+/H+ antiporter MnhB subunit
MNRGLLLRALRETCFGTAMFCLAFFLAELALGFVLPRFQGELTRQLQAMPFVLNMVRAMVGTEAAAELGPEMFRALPWAHPVPLLIAWAHAIVHCTRIPAGEVDRGTIDLLLGLPVSRWRIHLTETALWLTSGVVLMLAGIAGYTTGGALAGEPAPFPRTLLMAGSMLALYLAVGSIAWMCASWSDRRGRAVGVASVVVVGGFLLNYLAQFWTPLQKIAFLSLLQYHRPVFILRDGVIPWRDLAVLLGVAGIAWAAAGVIFARRDLATT